MSLMVDAVKKASEEKRIRDSAKGVSLKKSGLSFLAASAIVLILCGALASLYFYEESRIAALDQELTKALIPLNSLKSQNQILSQEKMRLEAQVADEKKKNAQKIDELLGKDRVLQYQNETLMADNSQKEKKIVELEAQIEKQTEREQGLMELLEEVKKQLTAKSESVVPAVAVTPVPTSIVPATEKV